MLSVESYFVLRLAATSELKLAAGPLDHEITGNPFSIVLNRSLIWFNSIKMIRERVTSMRNSRLIATADKLYKA